MLAPWLAGAPTCSVTRLIASSVLDAVSPTTSHQFSSLRPGYLLEYVGVVGRGRQGA